MIVRHPKKTFMNELLKSSSLIRVIKEIDSSANFVKNNNIFLNNFVPELIYKKDVYPYYDSIQKIIYVPVYVDKLPSHQMKDLYKHLKEKVMPFIVYHENGHAILDSLLNGQDPKMVKVGFLSSIHNTDELSLFLNGSKIKLHTPLEQFMYKNYQEAFCDCTAMYCLYKENKDLKMLDDIINYRQEELDKHNINNTSQLSGYMNISALNEFKNNIVNLTNKDYKNIYVDLNKIVLNGMKETIYDLADSNDLFLKALNESIAKSNRIKNKSVKGFFDYFDAISSSFMSTNQVFNNKVLLNSNFTRDVSFVSDLELIQTDDYSRLFDISDVKIKLMNTRGSIRDRIINVKII